MVPGAGTRNSKQNKDIENRIRTLYARVKPEQWGLQALGSLPASISSIQAQVQQRELNLNNQSNL